MTRNLRHLPGRELGVDVFGQLLAFLRQAIDLFGDVYRGVVLNETEFFDF